MSSKQREIYNGLLKIGRGIADFYLSGIQILALNVETKAHLLGHIAREIDGGLRDLLAIAIKDLKKCDECGKSKSEKGAHIRSICDALNIEEPDELANRWLKTGKQFHRQAHRRGIWQESREPKEMSELWFEYEDILFTLVGSEYLVLDRIDRILKYEKPDPVIINILPDLL